MLDLNLLINYVPRTAITIPLILVSPLVFVLFLAIYNHLSFAVRYYQRCPPGAAAPPQYPCRDKFFGSDMVYRMRKAMNDERIFQEIAERFDHVLPNSERKVHTYSTTMFGKTLIFTRDPENIKAILSTNFKDFGLPERRKKVLSEDFGEGIFGADGHVWETSRAMLRPNFKHSEFADLSFLERHSQALISRIDKDSGKSGKTVDLQELFPLLTLDSASELLLGESTDSLSAHGSTEGEEFKEAFNYATIKAARRIREVVKPLFESKRHKWAINYVISFVNKYVNEALRLRHEKSEKGIDEEDPKDGERYVFLKELATSDCTPDRIRTELINILVAGRDTTASLLSLLWCEISRRPEVVKKLREDIASLGGEAPTLEQLKGLKYLRWTINEVLRLHPIAPINSRAAIAPTMLPTGGGPDGKSPIFCLPGQEVIFSTYALQRRADLYGEDVLEFKPERWESLRPGWHYIPFSGGPRICIGQQLALNETGYTTVRLLQTFTGEVECRDPEPIAAAFSLIVTSKNGCKVGLSRK